MTLPSATRHRDGFTFVELLLAIALSALVAGILALLIAWAATAAILISATVLYKWLGRSVLTAIERLMGMLLVAISVQMVLDGVGTYLKLTPPNI